MRWFGKNQNREWDFEGRCVECHKPLDIFITVESQYKVILEIAPCETHPNESYILWPQRKDIIRMESK